MQKDNKNVTDNDNEKLNIKKSVFQSAREIEAQRKAEIEQQELEMQKQIELRKRRQQEEYDKKIQQERLELIRLKQGVIEESETIHEEVPAEIKLSF